MDIPYVTIMVSKNRRRRSLFNLAMVVIVVAFFATAITNAVIDYGEYKYCKGLHDMSKLKRIEK